MSPKVERPTLETATGRLAHRARASERTPGQWINVGTFPGGGTVAESPPFKNGWGNAGGGFANVSFYIDKWRRVHLRGAAEGGSVGTVIFTLPAPYRPDASERFVCPGDTGTTIIQIDPNGDVTQVS